MQKNELRDLLASAFASSLFKNIRLAAQTTKTGVGRIGLVVCMQIVERHVGKIWVESEPGNGAAFFFALAAQCDGTV